MFCYVHYMISKDSGITSAKIFKELYEEICNSGLLDKLQEIRVVTCGNLSNLKLDTCTFSSKLRLVRHCDDLAQYEFPTLLEIKSDCESLDVNTPILYIHLKGVTNGDSKWRKKLSNIVILRHNDCLEQLHEYNASGPLMCEPYFAKGKMPRHFSGNFWWTTCRHVKNLPNPSISELVKDHGFLVSERKNKNPTQPASHNFRYLAEFWIGLLDMESEHKLKEIK